MDTAAPGSQAYAKVPSVRALVQILQAIKSSAKQVIRAVYCCPLQTLRHLSGHHSCTFWLAVLHSVDSSRGSFSQVGNRLKDSPVISLPQTRGGHLVACAHQLPHLLSLWLRCKLIPLRQVLVHSLSLSNFPMDPTIMLIPSF